MNQKEGMIIVRSDLKHQGKIYVIIVMYKYLLKKL